MACMMLTANDVAMATTQLLEAADHVRLTWPVVRTETCALAMRWVVTVDENGRSRLRMHWMLENDGDQTRENGS